MLSALEKTVIFVTSEIGFKYAQERLVVSGRVQHIQQVLLIESNKGNKALSIESYKSEQLAVKLIIYPRGIDYNYRSFQSNVWREAERTII